MACLYQSLVIGHIILYMILFQSDVSYLHLPKTPKFFPHKYHGIHWTMDTCMVRMVGLVAINLDPLYTSFLLQVTLKASKHMYHQD